MVVCLEQGADLHMAQLMPLVPAHLGSPGKRAVKRVCVCVSSYWTDMASLVVH